MDKNLSIEIMVCRKVLEDSVMVVAAKDVIMAVIESSFSVIIINRLVRSCTPNTPTLNKSAMAWLARRMLGIFSLTALRLQKIVKIIMLRMIPVIIVTICTDIVP